MLAALSFMASFVAVASLVVWIGNIRHSPAEARLSRLARGGTKSASIDAPFSERAIQPFLEGLTRAFMQLLPQAFVARIGKRLIAAGHPVSTQGFFTLVLLAATLPPAAVFLLMATAGAGLSGVVIFMLFLLGITGALLPFLWLRRRVRARKTAIWRSLPDAFDLVTICVEAGLGLDAALRQVAMKLKGPLATEIQAALREVGMGRPRRQALEDMAERVDVSEVTTFLNAVIQAEQLGTSLGRVLRAQAVTLRVRRRQRAEEVARRAPIKMVFPLVFLILPSFFIVVLGPITVHLVDFLSE